MKMKTYTAGQVIDKLKIGQVAIKVDGELDYDFINNNGDRQYNTNFVGVYCDENDNGLLKSTSGSVIAFYKDSNTIKKDKFIIIDRETYERIKNE